MSLPSWPKSQAATMQQLQQLQPARRHRESWLRSCSHFKPARSPLINKATIITTERRGKAAQIKWNLIKNVNLAKLVPDGSGVGCLPAGMTQYPAETGRGGAKVAKGWTEGPEGRAGEWQTEGPDAEAPRNADPWAVHPYTGSGIAGRGLGVATRVANLCPENVTILNYIRVVSSLGGFLMFLNIEQHFWRWKCYHCRYLHCISQQLNY